MCLSARLKNFFRRRSISACAEQGTEIVEFSLVLIPMLGLTFLIMNIGWVLFAKASLQEAVREGVRYGVTGAPLNGQPGLTSSIRQVVLQYSAGFIPAGRAQTEISIQYLSPSTLQPVTGAGSCAGGNILQVSISGTAVSPLSALLISPSALNLGAISSDVMESSPNGIVPSCQ